MSMSLRCSCGAPARPDRRGPVALAPGEYGVRLTVDGQTYAQPVTVKPDPRGSAIDHANAGANTSE